MISNDGDQLTLEHALSATEEYVRQLRIFLQHQHQQFGGKRTKAIFQQFLHFQFQVVHGFGVEPRRRLLRLLHDTAAPRHRAENTKQDDQKRDSPF